MSQPPAVTQVLRLSRIAINVADLAISAAFYQEALGFLPTQPITNSNGEIASLLGSPFQSQTLQLADQYLELTVYERPGAPYPTDSRANDLWFQHFAIVTDDIEAVARRVERAGALSITQGPPQKLPASSGGVTAYKFRDPDGHPLELLSFINTPLPTTPLTKGINHTAISVHHTAASLTFYQEQLGLTLTHQQVNQGLEQDRLDGLRDTVVRVITVNTIQPGPHIELLAYQHPQPRALPCMQPTDVAATRTVLEVRNLAAFLEDKQYIKNKKNTSYCVHGVSDNRKNALISDPDGHWLLLQETQSPA